MTPFGSPVIGGQKPSLRFQKRLIIHAKIAQLNLLPLHNNTRWRNFWLTG